VLSEKWRARFGRGSGAGEALAAAVIAVIIVTDGKIPGSCAQAAPRRSTGAMLVFCRPVGAPARGGGQKKSRRPTGHFGTEQVEGITHAHDLRITAALQLHVEVCQERSAGPALLSRSFLWWPGRRRRPAVCNGSPLH
jgi:hypothetical protein